VLRQPTPHGAFDEEDKIVAADGLSNKNAKEGPRTHISDLVSVPFE
jgi:hypothetical protein